MAPSDPSIGSVNTTSAPNALRIRFRSGVTFSGTHSADHRVGDAGVPGGGVEQDLVAGERARLLAVGNHPRRRAILHRAARITPLGLGVELDVAETRLETRQPDEWGVSDQVDD
jgi:hypothetical protein